MRLDHLLSRESPSGKHSHGSSSRFRGKGPALLASVSGDAPLQVDIVATKIKAYREIRHIVEHHTMCSRKEDTMSIGWMPRRCVPKKDVA